MPCNMEPVVGSSSSCNGCPAPSGFGHPRQYLEGNIGHFVSEIEMDKFENFPGIKVEDIKPQVDRFAFRLLCLRLVVIELGSGRLLNLGTC